MRIGAAALVTTAAQRLKSLLPSLAEAPASVRREVFIVYSVLKHLGREMECREASTRAKQAALGRLERKLRRLAQDHPRDAWSKRLMRLIEAERTKKAAPGTEKVSGLVAALTEEIVGVDSPAWVANRVMAWIVEYLASENAIEMSVYRDGKQNDGRPGGATTSARGRREDAQD